MEINELSKANKERCEEVFHSINSWSPADWACALAGEVGECCNIVKKLKRLETNTNTSKDPQTKSEAIKLIGKEIADTIIYADLLATRLGLNLEIEIKNKFNEVSDRMKSNIKI